MSSLPTSHGFSARSPCSSSTTTTTTTTTTMPHAASPKRGPSANASSASITRFIRGCFTDSLCDVDFTQALTAVEHLAALDDRRKREFQAALRRLNIDEATLEEQKTSLRETAPATVDWITSMEDKARKAEALYTQAYIGLRRWMRLLPYDRRNCISMLDALYPAAYATLPTPQLTTLILNSQRDAFLKYIDAVGKHGRSVLKNLENQSKRPGDANGWPVVHDILERYLKQSNRIVNTASAVSGPESFERAQTSSPIDSDRSGRPELRPVRTSPAHVRRPSTATGTSADRTPSIGPNKLRKEQDEWLAKQKCRQQKQHSLHSNPEEPPRQLKKSRSTLNRLAQEFRRFKSRSADSHMDDPMRSTSSLERRRPSITVASRTQSRDRSMGPSERTPQLMHSRTASTEQVTSTLTNTLTNTSLPSGSSMTTFTIDDAWRDRLIAEAKRNKANREKRQHSPTHFKLEEERRYRRPRESPFDEHADDDRYFFITDSATRNFATPSTGSPSRRAAGLGAATGNPYAPSNRELQIAELAA